MASRPRSQEAREITAKPRSARDSAAGRSVVDTGLSIDPEDMGARALEDATEANGHTETLPVLGLTDPPASDAALASDVEGSLWTQTVEDALEHEGEGPSDALPALDDDDENDVRKEEIDVSESFVRDASLLDREGRVAGEVEAPDVETEDTGRRGRRGVER